jgi:integrase
VFGDEVGGAIASIKTTWRTACEKAGVVGLHFHDLRREFACRLLEWRAERHDVRDFLGHTNPTETLDGIVVGVVSQVCPSWNQVAPWLRRLEVLRRLPESPRPPQRNALD